MAIEQYCHFPILLRARFYLSCSKEQGDNYFFLVIIWVRESILNGQISSWVRSLARVAKVSTAHMQLLMAFARGSRGHTRWQWWTFRILLVFIEFHSPSKVYLQISRSTQPACSTYVYFTCISYLASLPNLPVCQQ